MMNPTLFDPIALEAWYSDENNDFLLQTELENYLQNYLKSLLALGFQAFLILVCVGIYAVLIQTIAATDDISGAIWSCMGYTVLLCFTLFKTGSLAKSVFSAH